MNIQELTETQIVSKDVLRAVVGNEERELLLRLKAKELKMTTIFDRKLKDIKKKMVKEKIERTNFCSFDDEKFNDICTGKWIADTGGIFMQVENFETGNVDLIEASRMEMVPIAQLKNIDTGNLKVELAYKSYGKWQSLIVEKSTISIAHKLVELSDRGIDVTSTNAKNLVDYFYDCLTLNDSEHIPLKDSCSRLGWIDERFIPFSRDIIFDGEQEHKHIIKSINVKGDGRKWLDLVAKLRNSLYFKMQFATSIVAPLISRLGVPSFITHFYGLSGSGKTVGAAVASSIWGSGAKGGMWRSVNGTNNWLMDLSAFLKNLPVVLDDTQDIRNKFDNYDKLVMQLCNGCERGRMKGSESQKIRTWETTFIFTGEESLVKDDSGGGVYNRVIEVDVSGKMVTPEDIGREIIQLIKENYGFMAKKLIEIYSNNLEEIENKYNDILNYIRKVDKDTTGKQNIAISMILLGDWIATKYFFKDELPLKYEELQEFAFTELEVDPSERAYDYIKSQIYINKSKFEGKATEVWGSIGDDRIRIDKSILSELLKKGGFDFKAVKKTWADKGYILKNSQGKYIHASACHGVRMSCVMFSKEDDSIVANETDSPF